MICYEVQSYCWLQYALFLCNFQDFRSVARRLSKFLLGHELDDDALARVEEHASVKGMRKSYDDIEKLRPDGKLITKMLGTHSFIQKGISVNRILT